MDNNYEYYFNKIMEIIKKRRTAKQNGLVFSHEEKQEMIFNIYNNIEFLVKTVNDEQIASKFI